MEKITKTIETEIGKIHLQPPVRTATEEDSKRLHSLIAKLLVEEYMENENKNRQIAQIG